MHISRVRAVVVLSSCLVVSATIWAGCGFERLAPALPDLAGLSLSQLEDIQDDDTLTENEKREAIREAIDAPETEGGEQLVDFLLNFNVP